MLLSCRTNDEILSLLYEYNQEANKIRDMVAETVVFSEGYFSFNEAWHFTHDDRISIKRAMSKLADHIKKQQSRG